MVVDMTAMRRRLRHLPAGLVASAVLLALGVPVGALVRGGTGAVGVAAGVVLVATSYVLSSLAVAWADSVHPRMVMPVGLTVYALKVIAIGLVMAAIAGSGWAGLVPMGIAAMAAALGWVAAQAWWTWHAKLLYVDPD
jgi:ATP synthase protein I